jgi:hypothetical protein
MVLACVVYLVTRTAALRRVYGLTDVGARLLQAVALGESLINVLLPVADAAAVVDTGGSLLSINGDIGSLGNNVDGAGSDADNGQSRDKKGLSLKSQHIDLV